MHFFGYCNYSEAQRIFIGFRASRFFLYFVLINKEGKFAVAKYRPVFKALYVVYGFRTEMDNNIK